MYQIQPLSYLVKRLIILQVFLWIFLVLILQNFFFDQPYVFNYLGLNPSFFLSNFYLWQAFTYMFIHSQDIFHILFNMICLWWVGSELELFWGRLYFFFYYVLCGFLSALIYIISIYTLSIYFPSHVFLNIPVVGASGAIFGLLIAYGKFFKNRVIYFMMMFPMKVRSFIWILIGIELCSLLSFGFSQKTAHLAHIGGLLSGFLILQTNPYLSKFFYFILNRTKKSRHHLRLVVDNKKEKKPNFWN